MESPTNVSSEEELLLLHKEGKIRETEYRELLNAMQKPPSKGIEEAMSGVDKKASK